jgi:hypothetical protein
MKYENKVIKLIEDCKKSYLSDNTIKENENNKVKICLGDLYIKCLNLNKKKMFDIKDCEKIIESYSN